LYATSAETNVASISSYLGLPVKVLTTFVKGSPIAQFLKNNLKSRHMDYEGPEVEQGDPWGYRHQINIADSGYGSRGPRVFNDRAGEVGRTLNTKDFDLERIFGEEGVQIVHLSGLIAALSPETTQFCLEVARAAKKHGTRISFDLNHRASFWKGREEQLHKDFTEIASVADILIGNEEDFQLCFGIEGPAAGGEGLKAKVVSVNQHLWGAIMLEGDNWHIAEPREIHVLDRIGGGDGFVGGMLYGILKGWDAEKWPQFGWATGAMATTFLTDYAQPADEEMVWSIWKGNARVKR
jgi:2-dehydro-3-deoxygluconokinase